MVIELTEEQKIKVINSDDVFRIMQDILLREQKIDQDRKHFWVISLASNNRIQNIELVSMGGTKRISVEPMNVFRFALIKGAVKVILVHNHPAGDLLPSEADKDITDRLIQSGVIIDVKVADHIILTSNSYVSFADTGLLAILEKSLKYVPRYMLEERIRSEEKRLREEMVRQTKEKSLEKGKKEGLKVGRMEGRIEGMQQGRADGLLEGLEEGAFQAKCATAQKLKVRAIPLADISDITGLTVADIERL